MTASTASLTETATRLVLIIALFIAGSASAADPAGNEAYITPRMTANALDELDRALTHRSRYIASRQAYIDSLSAAIRSHHGDSDYLSIADAYTSFNTDSAKYYLYRGLERATGYRRQPYLWRLASLMALTGMYQSAYNLYSGIDPDSIAPKDIQDYLEAGRQMYSYMSDFMSSDPETSQIFSDSVQTYQQRIINTLPPDSVLYRYHQAEYYLRAQRPAMAKVLLLDVFSSLSPTNNLYARTAHHLATVSKNEQDTDAYIYYLALSAKADVMAATREMISLQELGSQLENTNVERAYRYLTTALEDAVACGATLRTVDTSRTLPLIEKAHSANIRAQQRTIYIIMGVMALLIILMTTLWIFLRYEMIKLKRLQTKLRQVNKEKDIYISQFLQLCSIYMDKLNQFCKIANRKLAAGQADELYRMTKSGKFAEEHSEEFYSVFDDAFMHIYPQFVQRVNDLLLPDRQIVLKEGEKLNTDLRILAFMRLGIEESSKIAQVLNYSLNTIYSYRNRLKLRAKNRDTFEADILAIPSVE